MNCSFRSGEIQRVKLKRRDEAFCSYVIENTSNNFDFRFPMGQTGMAALLLQNNADVNAKDDISQTPLHSATKEGNFLLMIFTH